MAFFSDSFTDTDGVLLQNHTPNVGTSWTRLWGDTNTNAEINTNRCRSDGDLNAGVMYTADATYPSADYDITCTMVTMVGNNDRPIYLLVRVQDQENMYAVRLETTTSESSLYKKVSGTWTAVGSLFTKPANGSVIKLEIIGTALKFYDDGVELASATVSDHAAAGKAGIAFGGGAELVNSTDDGSTSNVIDDLTVNDLGGGTTEFLEVSGSVTPTGNLIKYPKVTMSGSVTPTGALIKSVISAYAGQVTPTGEPDMSVMTRFSGSVTPTGNLIRSVLLMLVGQVTATGALVKRVLTAYSGQVSPTGEPDYNVQTRFAGSVTPTGALEAIRIILLTLDGSVTPTGSLLKNVWKSFSGSVTASGALIKSVLTSYTGQVTPTGEPDYNVQTRFSGSVTPTGTLTNIRLVLVSLAGSVTPTGALRFVVGKIVNGTVTPTGNLIKRIITAYSGQITPTGEPDLNAQTVFSGSVTPTGSLSLVTIIGGAVAIVERLFKGMYKGMFKRMR